MRVRAIGAGGLLVGAALACSASDDVKIGPDTSATSSGSGGATASTGAGAGGNGQPGAGGSGPATEQQTVACSTLSGGTAFAVADFPDRSAAELAGARFIGTPTGAWVFAVPSGFTSSAQSFGLYVKDGSIAVGCGPASGPYYSQVQIIVPID